MSNFPTIDFSRFELPKLDLPNLEMPEFELPTAEQVLGFARDAAYVGVGLVVVTAERIQKWQQEVFDALKEQIERVRAAV